MNADPRCPHALLLLAMGFVALPDAQAQTGSGHEGHDMPGMTAPTRPAPTAPSTPPASSTPGQEPAPPKAMESMPPDHEMESPSAGQGSTPMPANQDMNMPGMEMGPMQGGRPPPDARDPDAYAEGLERSEMHGMEMADDETFYQVLVDQLEIARSDGENGGNWDAEAWYGNDHNKLWLKSEGEGRAGGLESTRTEALWDRLFATFWSTQLGLRHDTGPGDAQHWLAVGVQGLAPYWFHTEATAYLGESGMLAARLEVKYELLFTQRLILQPTLEANLYSKDDAERRIGAGLAEAEAGLRLRYEITRQFAPYVGINWTRRFGDTADFARGAGEDVSATEAVAGLRLWF